MDTDSDVSIIKGSSSIKNYNVRFTVTEDGQADAAISNEKGTKIISNINIEGVPIGYCTLADYLVLFVTGRKGRNKDGIYIYKYTEEKKFLSPYLYNGDFNFSIKAPIEC